MFYTRLFPSVFKINQTKIRHCSTIVRSNCIENEYNFMHHVKLYWKSSESLSKKRAVTIPATSSSNREHNEYLNSILLMRLFGIRPPVDKKTD